MPHITYEATGALALAIDWPALMTETHHAIAATGHAAITDLKSRMVHTAAHLAGDHPAAEFVVARLTTTKPRPDAARQEIARIIHARLEAAITAVASNIWWQACVLDEQVAPQDYVKSGNNPA
jgi:5-carboxymethyl-2-hydroxymuconate isomerase